MKDQTSSNLASPKKVTKAQRIKDHARGIYSGLLIPIQHKLATTVPPVDLETVKKAFNSCARASIDAAEIFDNNWEAVKGRFNEDKD